MNWICKQKRWISIGCFLITCVFVVFGYQSGIFTDTQKMQAFLELPVFLRRWCSWRYRRCR